MVSTCVVGLGSPHGDDQFGWVVADLIASQLENRHLHSVAVRRASSPTQLLDWLDGVNRLILIDACRGLSPPGHVLQLDWPAKEIEHVLGSGSHDYTVWQTLELADRLGRLPRQCRLWCVGGLHFDPNEALSPSLVALAPQVADDVFYALTNDRKIPSRFDLHY